MSQLSSSTDPHFRTLARSVQLTGTGLHSGCRVEVRLHPRSQPGITFIRTDLRNQEISASWRHVTNTFHATVLGRGEAVISTPEHLLAALWGMGITHCQIEINGPEVPILDGSAAPWCALLETAGSVPVEGDRPLWRLEKPLLVEDHGASMLAVPYPGLRFSVGVDFEAPYLPPQLVDFDMAQISFCGQIAPARTFTLEKWIEPLRAQGLIRGGSTDNALVLGEETASSPLRFPDELARHKMLDALGDLALFTAEAGALLQGHFILLRAGHAMHYQWIKAAAQGTVIAAISKN